MFGNKNKIPSRVGAREKMRMARNIAGGGSITPKGKDGKEASPAASILTVLIMAIALAYLVTEVYISQGGLRLSVGNSDLDRLLFKPDKPQFFGMPEVDYILLILIRGGFIALAAGIWPFVSLVVQKAMDNAQINIFRLFWGTPIGIALFVIIVKDVIWPGVAAIVGS